MAVAYNTIQQTVYYQMSTRNKSFLEMHHYLKDTGRRNNKWMLILLDPDLAKIDPYDPRLPALMKQKVLRECVRNPMYFLREIVRIPESGIMTGIPYKLHRGNMALTFCLMLNLNIMAVLPRQTGKTQSALAWYLWLFNFGSSFSEMNFLNKKMDDSKLNLDRIRQMRDLLPSYLKMDKPFMKDGTKIKGRDSVENLRHPVNNNSIRCVASARNKTMAASLLRGRTTPILYWDEHGFTLYNDIIMVNMVPAFVTASANAKKNNKPYGILITTTPGMLTTDEGINSFNMKNNATPFDEGWYDLTVDQIIDIINSNNNSNYVYIEYSYQQLGYSEEWFKRICIEMGKKWDDIRREVLLEWSMSSENSPFRKEDLDTIRGLLRLPIQTVLMLNKYPFHIFEKINNNRAIPIIGVDVSGGYSRDSSAITIIDSESTRVTAELNCNFISTPELAAVIYEIVSRWMPNAVVNIERNGGYGASVISKLLTTSIKKNLFYTIKDKIVEEKVIGSQVHRKTQKTKIYGSDSTKNEREKLMEILRNRVDYHKDKIISKTIYDELVGLEVKKNGRIEHSSNTHDDQIFSWLWALYVWYSDDVMNQWGIRKKELRTDADLEEAVFDLKENTESITEEIEIIDNEMVQEQLKVLADAPGAKLYNEWREEEYRKDQESLARLLATKQGREAYAKAYNYKFDENDDNVFTTIPDSVFDDFYSGADAEERRQMELRGNLYNVWAGIR